MMFLRFKKELLLRNVAILASLMMLSCDKQVINLRSGVLADQETTTKAEGSGKTSSDTSTETETDTAEEVSEKSSFALGQTSTSDNIHIRLGFKSPHDVAFGGGKFFVADRENFRVLGWNSVPIQNQKQPDFVIGQYSLTSGSVYAGGTGVGPIGLSAVNGTFTDGTRLFIADSNNNRVLIWNTIPTQSDRAPDLVLGQPDFVSNSANNGGISAATLASPNNVYSDGTRVIVADTNNQRVLIWNTMPTSNFQAANVVLGQPDFVSSSSNNGGRSYSTMNYPMHLTYDGSNLLVSDTSNHRVLVWTSLPSSNGQSANFVLGQPNNSSGTSNNGGVSGSSMYNPLGVYSNGTKIVVADFLNHRALIWNSFPSTDGATADLVIGQLNLTSNTVNGGGISASSLRQPRGVHSDGTKLVIADNVNDRVLIWNSIPTTDNRAADVILGQADSTSSEPNDAGNSGLLLRDPTDILVSGEKLFLADVGRSRVLIWNQMPESSQVQPDVVLGQIDFTSSGVNSGGVSAASMNYPMAIASDGSKLVVADLSNHRVQIWNTLPTVNKQAANLVLGQPDFSSVTGNNGGIGASTLNGPNGAIIVGQRLYIADTSNNRVLGWNTFPTTTQQAADFVLGQPNMASDTPNNGGASLSSLYYPEALAFDGTRFYVVDRFNHRVLIWNQLPTATGTPADVVVGQSNATSVSQNAGGSVSASGLNSPTMISVRDGKLFILDTSNHRILYWSSIPTSDGVPATSVFGQSSLSTAVGNSGGISASSLYFPYGLAFHSSWVFVADTLNSRVLVHPLSSFLKRFE